MTERLRGREPDGGVAERPGGGGVPGYLPGQTRVGSAIPQPSRREGNTRRAVLVWPELADLEKAREPGVESGG